MACRAVCFLLDLRLYGIMITENSDQCIKSLLTHSIASLWEDLEHFVRLNPMLPFEMGLKSSKIFQWLSSWMVNVVHMVASTLPLVPF